MRRAPADRITGFMGRKRDCAERSECPESIDYATPDLKARHHDSPCVLVDHIARKRSYIGDAAVRLVARLRKQVALERTPWFPGEIHPDNKRSVAFFARALRAGRVGTLHRDGHPWVIYAAPV